MQFDIMFLFSNYKPNQEMKKQLIECFFNTNLQTYMNASLN